MRVQQDQVREFHVKHGFARDLLSLIRKNHAELLRLEDMNDGTVYEHEQRRTCNLKHLNLQLHLQSTLLVRAHLMQEELAEFSRAAANQDLVGMTDALADLLYVVLGSGVTLGIDLEPAFAEVHRSNMTKPTKRVGDGHHPAKNGGYTPPALEPILEEQGLLTRGDQVKKQ